MTKGPEARKIEGPSALSASADQMTIATFNIENYPGKGGSEAQERVARIGSIIATNLKAPDVVALQEQQVRQRMSLSCSHTC